MHYESTANVCQFISSRSAVRKPSFLRSSPHTGRLHLLFITSWLYFSSKFQANVQRAKKETLPVYERERHCYCERPDRAPSLSGVTTQILFRPCRTICQYPGIYRPLTLAGHREECVRAVYSLTKTSSILTLGGEDGEGGGSCRNSSVQIALQINHAE